MKAKFWYARKKLQQQREANQIKIKSRKHNRKQAQKMSLISDESEEAELREDFNILPNPLKKYELEPIEEEVDSENES
jgi:hypothetical protein